MSYIRIGRHGVKKNEPVRKVFGDNIDLNLIALESDSYKRLVLQGEKDFKERFNSNVLYLLEHTSLALRTIQTAEAYSSSFKDSILPL